MERSEDESSPRLGRRQFLRLAALATAAAFAPQLAASTARAGSAATERWADAATGSLLWNGTLPSNANRALAAYAAQQAYFYRRNAIPGDKTALYLEQVPEANTATCSFAWPFSQAIAATLDLLGLPDGLANYLPDVQDRFYRGLPNYWDGTSYCPSVAPVAGKAGVWYDDNAWIGLDLVRFYRLTGDGAALARAEQVFAYIVTGWAAAKNFAAPGGIFWVQGNANRHRNTCSNAPSAELGLRLYQLTHKPFYLEWAQKTYNWVNASLRGPDGLYWDHLDPSGNVDKRLRTYNQGAMIGAGALLYSITGDNAALTQARITAGAALALYAQSHYAGQPPAFNAIFFRNLLLLATVDTTYLPATQQSMQQWADNAWVYSRDYRGLFPYPGRTSPARLLHQAGMVQAHACLAWDPARYDLLV